MFDLYSGGLEYEDMLYFYFSVCLICILGALIFFSVCFRWLDVDDFCFLGLEYEDIESGVML